MAASADNGTTTVPPCCCMAMQREDGLGNDRASGPRAELSEVALSERVNEAIARAQRETRRKYGAKVSEIEVAFAQLTADNRKLRARVGQLTKGRGSEGQTTYGELIQPFLARCSRVL